MSPTLSFPLTKGGGERKPWEIKKEERDAFSSFFLGKVGVVIAASCVISVSLVLCE